MTILPDDIWFLIISFSNHDAISLKQIRSLCHASHRTCERYMQALLRQRVYCSHLIPGRSPFANWHLQTNVELPLVDYDKSRVSLSSMGSGDYEFDEPLRLSFSMYDFFMTLATRQHLNK